MAPTPELATRIDRQLQALLAEVQDLPALAREWDTLDEGTRASQSLDWDHLMADYLTELDDHRRHRELTIEQERRYYEVLRLLRDAMPILDQLHFSSPPVELDVGSGPEADSAA